MKLSKNTTIKRLCDMLMQANYASDPEYAEDWQSPDMVEQSIFEQVGDKLVYTGAFYWGALAIALVNIVGVGGYQFWLNTSEYPLNPSDWEEDHVEAISPSVAAREYIMQGIK